MSQVTNDASASGGGGDVSAAANIADNALVRGDGGAKGVQDSGVLLGDDDIFSGLEGQNLPSTEVIGTPTYNTLELYHRATGSSAVISGCTLSDGGSGTLDIAAGTIFVRTTASDVGVLVSADYAGATGQALTDNSANFVYIAYNAGTPAINITTTPSATPQDNVVIGVVYRSGTTLHISEVNISANQVTQKLGRRLTLIDGVTRQSGLVVGETGTRNITITSGTAWLALTDYSLAAVDTSAAGTFSYFYSDGAGGFTEVASSTQINNTQYDDGSGSLATLSNNQYGLHWVYRGIDGDTYVVYGTESYNLTEAENATSPASLPLQITTLHTVILAKIIIQKSASSFTGIESAFDKVFQSALAGVHGDLSGLQGGTTDEYYHLTLAQHSVLVNNFSDNTDTADATPKTIATVACATGAALTIKYMLTAKQSDESKALSITGQYAVRNPAGTAIEVGTGEIQNVVSDFTTAGIAWSTSAGNAIAVITGEAATTIDWTMTYEVVTDAS